MKKKLHHVIIEQIRNRTPLGLRQKVGPFLAHLYYIDRIYVRPNTKKPHILSIEETVDTVFAKKCSMIRFGDGEITLIDGTDLPFQKWSEELAKRLEDILQVRDEHLLICIPGMWGDLRVYLPYAYHFVMHHMYRYNHIWKSILSYDYTYGDTNVTRHYLSYKDKRDAAVIFKKIRGLWAGEDVILIEGAKSRLGLGNDLFDNVASLGRILCPPENAYVAYERIRDEALKANKEKLILLSLGPTAKVLAYDMFLAGYRVLDIGHIDMEYEMFLRKETKQVKVPHKYFNEINERAPEDTTDEKYLSQILATIA